MSVYVKLLTGCFCQIVLVNAAWFVSIMFKVFIKACVRVMS